MSALDRSRSAVSRGRARRGRLRAISMPASRICRSSARTATPTRAGIAENEPFPDPAQLLDRARPLHLPHAVQPGRPAGGSRRADARRLAGRDRRAQDLAAFRRELSSCSAARRRGCGSTIVLSDVFGIDEPLTAATADAHYDRIAECLASGRVPAARAVRALQHRGDRHDRGRARRSALAQDDPRKRLERARRHRLPAGCGRRSRFRRLFTPISTGWARSPAAIPAPGPAISTPTARGAPSSSSSARPRRITAIRPPRPPTFRMPPPRSCSTACAPRPPTSASKSCSAPRC